MKIALFCDELSPSPSGGIGTFTLTLAEGLRRAGHEITLIETGDNAAIAYDQTGFRRVTIKKSRLRYLGTLITRIYVWTYLQKSWLTKNVEITEIPDFEGYVPFPSLMPIVVRLHTSTTLIFKMRGLHPPTSIHLYEYLTLKLARSWIGVSNFITRETEMQYRLTKKSKCTVYNPVIPSSRRKSKYGYSQVILFAGTLSEAKGVLALSQSLVTVFESNESVKVMFAGKSTVFQGKPIEATIRDILHKHLDRVTFTGHMSHKDVVALMAESACLVSPSKFESFGLVVAEAMAVGLPVIFTKRASGPELIRHGETGLLVDPDNTDEIAEAIVKIIGSPVFASDLANAARKHCLSHYSINKCIQQTTAQYRKVLSE
jgi:glycogen(starch) synthase